MHIQSNDPPSKMGFVSRICCSIQECFPLIAARYCNSNLVFSVLPAPDSPLTTMHWFCLEKIVANVKVTTRCSVTGFFSSVCSSCHQSQTRGVVARQFSCLYTAWFGHLCKLEELGTDLQLQGLSQCRSECVHFYYFNLLKYIYLHK